MMRALQQHCCTPHKLKLLPLPLSTDTPVNNISKSTCKFHLFLLCSRLKLEWTGWQKHTKMLHKCILAVLKVSTNVDTTVKNVYAVNPDWKLETVKEKCHDCLRHCLAQLAMFSVDSGILLSLYASTHHLHTTLTTGEWMIFWLSEDSPVEVGSTECSCHLVFKSSLHVRSRVYNVWKDFKMEWIRLLKDMLQRRDWMVKLDLKDE